MKTEKDEKGNRIVAIKGEETKSGNRGSGQGKTREISEAKRNLRGKAEGRGKKGTETRRTTKEKCTSLISLTVSNCPEKSC